MKPTISNSITGTAILVCLLTLSTALMAQTNPSYEQAKAEIIDQFGVFPSMFEKYPDNALAGAWDSFKQLTSENSAIPGKYRELIQLAVAAQIPCQYCIYFHTAMAKAHGATEEEIQEAVANGAATRHWSMILQGNQIEYEDFKKEFDGMMEFMANKSASK